MLAHAIRQPVDLGGEAVTVGASIGAAVTPTDGTDFTSLLHTADQRMYVAKHSPRAPQSTGLTRPVRDPQQAART